jgi:hypothetical protein
MTWQQQAACAGQVEFSLWPVNQALALCRGCPVIELCGRWARANRYTGVAGGRALIDGHMGDGAKRCIFCSTRLRDWRRRYCNRPACQRERNRVNADSYNVRHRGPAQHRHGETTHGTAAGARWHYRHGDKPCADCLVASRYDSRVRSQRARSA